MSEASDYFKKLNCKKCKIKHLDLFFICESHEVPDLPDLCSIISEIIEKQESNLRKRNREVERELARVTRELMEVQGVDGTVVSDEEFIRMDLAAVNEILADLPEESAVERIGFESKKKELEAKLERINQCHLR